MVEYDKIWYYKETMYESCIGIILTADTGMEMR